MRQQAPHSIYPYDEELEDQCIRMKDILNHPVHAEEIDLAAYEPIIQDDPGAYREAIYPLRHILGRWNGYLYSATSETPLIPIAGMISMTFHPCAPPCGLDLRFEASDRSDTTDYEVDGICSWGITSNLVTVTFKRTFPVRTGFVNQYWFGELDLTKETISGTWCNGPPQDQTTNPCTFILKRTAPEYLCLRPAPAVFEANKTRALWLFALAAVQDYVRRQSCSWSVISERRDRRNRFIELHIRDEHFGRPLTLAEQIVRRSAKQGFTNADSRFVHSLFQYQVRRIIAHKYVTESLESRRV